MPPRFARQAQRLEHLQLVLHGRRSTWSTFIEVGGNLATCDAFGRRLVLRGRRSTLRTFIEVGGSLATCDAFGRRLVLRGRRNTWSASGSFCMAGAALGASQVRFCVGRRSTWSTFIEVGGSLATSDAFGRRLLLCGRRSTWSISGSFCVAGAALCAPS